MEISRLIKALSAPSAYPGHPDGVEVHQTHISVVFLAGAHAYKIKKGVVNGFLDYGSLDAIYPPGIIGLPETFLINRSGKVVHVNDGESVGGANRTAS